MKKKFVIKGGLGNQLFQYVFARYCNIKMGYDVELLGMTHKILDTKTSRKQLLDQFNISLPWTNHVTAQRYSARYKNDLLSRIIRKVSTLFLKQPNVVFEKTSEKSQILAPEHLKSAEIVDGFWQNSAYFLEVESQIINELQLKAPLDQANQEALEAIRTAQTSIAVHVRALHDDIKTKAGTNKHGTLGKNYYTSALEVLSTKVSNPTFFVFSDNIPACKDLFSNQENVHYMTHNSVHNGHLDLFLMSQCHHIIMANSTFSWWAALLNAFSDKIIIRPRAFYGDPELNKKMINAFPKSWITVA